MVNMRIPLYLIFLLILLVHSCSERDVAVELQLTMADSLMFVSPDSSLSMLSSIEPLSRNFNSRDKARYALLMTQARARNYVKATDDSLINIAIDYYSATNDKERLGWSRVYASDIYHQLGNDSLALYAVRKAKDEAMGVHNPLLHFYIHYFWGNMTKCRIPYENGIRQLELAKHYASMMQDTAKIIVCLNEMAAAQIFLNNFDKAKEELKESESLALRSNITKFDNSINREMAFSYYFQDSLEQALDYVDRAIEGIAQMENGYGNPSNTYELRNSILIKLGKYDEFKSSASIDKMTVRQRGSYYLDLSRIESGLGHYREALDYHIKYAACLDSIYRQMIDDKVLEWQKKYDVLELTAERDSLKAKNRKVWIIVLAMVAAILLCVTVCMFIVNRNKRIMNDTVKAKEEMMNEAKNRIMMKTNEILRDKDARLERMRGRILDMDKAYGKVKNLIEAKDCDINTIKTSTLTSEEIQGMKESLNASDNDFITRLRDEYPLLKDRDLTIVCLIKFGAKNRDMMLLLGYSENTLKKYKNRMKTECLGLSPDSEPLDEWILNKDYPEEEEN